MSEHRAHTGVKPYDSAVFNGRPRAEVVRSAAHGIAVVRHLGVASPSPDGWVHSRNCKADFHTILLNGCDGIRMEGRIGGERVEGVANRGSMSLVPAGAEIDIRFQAHHTALIVYIASERMTDALAGAESATLAVRHLSVRPRLVQLLALLDAETRVPDLASDLIVDGLLRAITGLLSDAADQNTDTNRIHLTPAKLRRVASFIDENLHREIGLADLAACAGLSPYHFSRVFKRQTGDSPYRYLRNRRIDRALSLLARNELSLADLAAACGFASQSHFTAAFTKALGAPPGRFRKRLAA